MKLKLLKNVNRLLLPKFGRNHLPLGKRSQISRDMKEITLRISDKKLPFFLELAKQLGVEVVQDETPVPQWQQEQVRQAKQQVKDGTAEASDWKQLKKGLFEKYNVK